MSQVDLDFLSHVASHGLPPALAGTVHDDETTSLLREYQKKGIREVEWQYGFEAWQNTEQWRKMGSVCPVCFALDGQRFKIEWLLQNAHHNAPCFSLSHVNCVPPETEIMMSDGSVKPIVNVVVGDAVIGHDGKSHLVTGTSKRQYRGEVVKITPWGGQSLTLTKNHRVYARKDRSKFPSGGGLVKGVWDFVESAKLSAGRRRDHVVSDCVYFPTVVGESSCPLSNEEVELFGYWMAEGCTRLMRDGRQGERRIALIFSLGRHENDFAARIALLCKSLDPEANVSVRKTARSYTIYFGSKKYTKRFVSIGGLGARDKKLYPDAILWPVAKQRIFLTAFIRGDGHMSTRSWSEDDANKTHRVYVVTHSQQLANQLYVMLDRCRVPATFNTSLSPSGPQNRGENRFNHYQLHFNRWSWDGVGKAPHSNSRVLIESNSIASKINSVEIIQYDGFVYNISVAESESYIANRIAVHNCACIFKVVSRKDEQLDYSETVDVAPSDIPDELKSGPISLEDVPQEQREDLGLPGEVNNSTDVQYQWDEARGEILPISTQPKEAPGQYHWDEERGEIVQSEPAEGKYHWDEALGEIVHGKGN